MSRMHDAFRPLWEGLPATVRAQVEKDAFHLTRHTARNIVDHKDLAPQFPLDNAEHSLLTDLCVGLFLRDIRLERNKKRSQAAAAKRREVDNAQKAKAREQKALNEKFIILAGEGRTRKEISETLGIGHTKISSLARTLDVEITPDTSSNVSSAMERAKRCMIALQLQASGSTRKQIASRLNCTTETVKVYLRDARYYSNPAKYPNRHPSKIEEEIIKKVSSEEI